MRQSTYRNRIFLPRFFPDTYRDTETEEYRFHYTYLQDEMKRFHFICRLLHDGTPQRPIEGVGDFVPRDWKERREWEKYSEGINTDKLKKKLKFLLNPKIRMKKQPVVEPLTGDPNENIVERDIEHEANENLILAAVDRATSKDTETVDIYMENSITDNYSNPSDEDNKGIDTEVTNPGTGEQKDNQKENKNSFVYSFSTKEENQNRYNDDGFW